MVFQYIDNNEKQKLYNLDFTLESVRNYAKNYHTKYIEECKQKLPSEIHICLKIYALYIIIICMDIQ